MKVYILTVYWLDDIEESKIIAVCDTLEKAQKILLNDLEEDLQYNNYKNIEARGITLEKSDLFEFIKKNIPIPTDYIILYNEEKYSNKYLEYNIEEKEVI